MSFQTLYIWIPILLFLIRPIKDNNLYALYILLLAILSYDNVTDFGFFIAQFREIYNYNYFSGNIKGLEWGWNFLYHSFSFTEYGFVILHSLSFVLVIITFLKYSKKLGLLNVSIFLCFIMEAFTKHDNIMRHNVALIFAFYAYFDILKGGPWRKKRIVKLGTLTFCAFLFHFSAVVLIPYYLFLKWFVKKKFKLVIVLPVVLLLDVLRYLGYSKYFLLFVFFFLPTTQSDYLQYYLEGLLNTDTKDIRVSEFLYMLLAIVPLLYYTLFRKSEYLNNQILRLSVNLSCIVITWTDFFYGITFFTRIIDYFLWFEIWAFGYMIKDAFTYRNLSLCARFFVICILFILCFKHIGVVNSYYAENKYMTILSEDCKLQQIYNRDLITPKSEQVRTRR